MLICCASTLVLSSLFATYNPLSLKHPCDWTTHLGKWGDCVSAMGLIHVKFRQSQLTSYLSRQSIIYHWILVIDGVSSLQMAPIKAAHQNHVDAWVVVTVAVCTRKGQGLV
jgi:hypothetical protein